MATQVLVLRGKSATAFVNVRPRPPIAVMEHWIRERHVTATQEFALPVNPATASVSARLPPPFAEMAWWIPENNVILRDNGANAVPTKLVTANANAKLKTFAETEWWILAKNAIFSLSIQVRRVDSVKHVSEIACVGCRFVEME